MAYNVLVLNPGSTSTKMALFADEKEIFSVCIKHDAKELLRRETVGEQVEYRNGLIREYMQENGIVLPQIDAIVGRGGGCGPVPSGTFEVNELLADVIGNPKKGIEHASFLGVPMAMDFNRQLGARVFMLDPICVDEYSDVARITGIKGVYRKAICHALNLKGTARMHCKNIGTRYEDTNLIVCHIDGGVTVTAHQNGRMIDSNNGTGGDGPFTPTRIGSVAVSDILDYLETHTPQDVRRLCAQGGGFVSHFGTSDSDEVYAMVQAGNKKAAIVWEALIYNLAKTIGSMSVVLCGKVDGIVLTGRLVRFESIVEGIREKCGWIAPITVYPNEVEHESMAAGALRVLRGECPALEYTGKPVWNGFEE